MLHYNQFQDFCDIDPRATGPGLLSTRPFFHDGHTYATDRRCIIRQTGQLDGAEAIGTDAKSATFATKVKDAFAFFDSLILPTLIPLSSLVLEPVIVRESLVSAPIDFANPAENDANDTYVARSTPIKIGTRWFDAKRLLFIRQTLPNVAFYEEPGAASSTTLRFVFDDGGQGALMPMKTSHEHDGMLHWNGARYFAGY